MSELRARYVGQLGRVGIWSGAISLIPAAEARRVLGAVEDAGFSSLWIPESFAKEVFAHTSALLASSRDLVIATGIANILARDPTAMINGARTVVDAYPGRFVLGVGVSHAPSARRRGAGYDRPFTMMERYLEDMASATWVGPELGEDPRVILAALGPRMLSLAAQHTDGAHPYFVPVDHTRDARRIMGDEAFLAPEQGVVLAADAAEARAVARRHARRYLALDNYRNNLLRLGFDEADLAGDGSDDLIDAVVAWGSVEDIVARVAAHLDAGADHVPVQLLNGPERGFAFDVLDSLAPALLEL